LAFAFGASAAGAATNNISTVAGTGVAGGSGDGGPATAAQLGGPVGVTALPDGGYLIAQQYLSLVRRVSPTGIITTVAGNGTTGFSGDNGPATSAQLNIPSGAVMTPDGGYLIADTGNNRVRRVSPTGTITTAVGTGAAAFGGDNGPAAQAQINFPYDISLHRTDGSYLIADVDNNRIRRVSIDGTITTVAGDGSFSSGGDGGPATAAGLVDPSGVAYTSDGGYLIGDTSNNRVRKVDQGGTITTVAGTGTAGFGGDGGAATAAQLNGPIHVSDELDGGFVITDRMNHRVRRVSPSGMITTVAGTGAVGFSGDGGLATAAQLNGPFGVAVTAGERDYLIADSFNNRIRFVDARDPPALPPPTRGQTVNAVPETGTVLVKVPGAGKRAAGKAHAAANRFVPLQSIGAQIPVGSTLDTSKGTVHLFTAKNAAHALQDGHFNGGLFVIGQGKKNPLTTLSMTGGGFNACSKLPPGGSRKEQAAAAKKKRKRRLFSNVKGRFRARGRNSTATTRGTKFTVTDTCAGTRTTVTRGSVVVRDLTLKKNRTVKRGHSYLAKPPKRRK
jgi:hypothetical protein